MVVVLGMNKAVGLLSYPPKQSGDPEFVRPHSEETAQLMDQEKKALVDEQYKYVKELLSKHEDKLLALSALLLQKEVLVTEDLVEILGERPYGLKDQYKKYVDVRKHLREEREAKEADTKEAGEESVEVEIGEKKVAHA
jgi:hypothetical protein